MKKYFFDNPILVISLLLAIGIASTEVSTWISLFAVVMILWKFLSEKKLVRELPKLLAPLLGFFIFLMVYIQYRTLWGQEESTTILLGLAAITIANFSTDRDHQFLVLLGFIIIMIKTIFSIDLIWMGPSMIAFLGLWLSLVTNTRISKFKFIFWHAVKSTPALLLLFFLFPRIVIFQTSKAQKKQAKVGISESLNPGQIGEIAAQSGLAFRAEFVTPIYLSTNELYWRGAVLNLSNNLEWLKGAVDQLPNVRKKFQGQKIQYKIVAEPSSNKIVFTLDALTRIGETNRRIDLYDAGTFRTTAGDDQQLQYLATSILDAPQAVNDDPKNPEQDYLQIPTLPPKTRAWIDQAKAKHKTLQDRLKALQDFFINPKFVYTLSPGRYNDMDEFLFSRYKGFCEHYAASYATMARALGIPARVVIGYQGGLYNTAGGFWKVSQKDAHAWTEIGLSNKWIRVDPTQWVSPLRLNLGGEQFFALSEDDQILFSHTKNWRKDDDLTKYWDVATTIFEDLNYKWTLFLLNYDKETQLSFLKDLSSEWPTAILVIFLIAALIVTLMRRRPTFAGSGLTPISKLMLYIEFKSTQLGIEIKNSTTPINTLGQLENIFEDHNQLISRFKHEYETIVYEEKAGTQPIKKWKKEWSSFFKEKRLKADL
ncbi:MAG: DUF3488 domain-containing protein [Bdellovibrio sp.]|nr:DUF3488 domain-containing protein [Bdellovibrio sp.]